MRRKKVSKRFGYRRVFKKRKSFFLKGIFWLFVLLFFCFSGSLYFFLFSSFFQIKKIDLAGDMGGSSPSSDEIKKIIAERASQKFAFCDFNNIFFANIKGIENAITNKFPEIAKITIQRQFPDVLAAQIENRKPAAIFCGGGDCYFIDKEGVVFEKTSPYSQNFSIIRAENQKTDYNLGDKAMDKDKITQILQIDGKIKNTFKIGISEIVFVSQKRINVKTLEGWEIYFNPSKDIGSQLTKLQAVLNEKSDPKKRKGLEYIDLRFDKIYIFPGISP